MRLSTTLSLYLGRQFLGGIGLIFGCMMALVFLFDFIEHLRRSAGREDAAFIIIVQMTLLNLPTLAQKLLPFAALFGGLMVYSRLTRSNELIVARAAGISVWQFLAPGLIIALLLGVFQVTVFNPLAAVLISKYEQLESRYLEGRQSQLAVSGTGLWLRQADEFGQSVIHAQQVSSAGTELQKVIIFLYHGADQFVGRIDAESATLRDGYWELKDALETRPDEAAIRNEHYSLRTTLTLEQIQDSFASPETLSFWTLPKFILTLEAAGFSAVRHRLYWHSTLATPLLLCAMVLLAATFSLRLTRRRFTGLLIAVGVMTGFLLYFISDVMFALGLAGNLPVAMAAWTPTGVSALFGLALLFHLEDG